MQLSSLEPKTIWHYFEQILEIPRPSKEETKIRNFLTDFAKKHKLAYKVDEGGNLLIQKSATPGFEKKKIVILQSHMDMVGEKNSETIHNFSQDPISPKIEKNWVKAIGTTLGADDGIGIAAQMAILASKEIEHGPVECLFTVDEETGLTGAMALKEGFFKGKILLNLDSEDEGELFIGCAGGIDTIAELKYKTRIYPNRHVSYRIEVSGLNGGHSGDEIHKSPGGNSNKIINRFLWKGSKKFNLRLASFEGGNLRNAIPREANAVFAIPESEIAGMEIYFKEFSEMLKEELGSAEPNFKTKLVKVKKSETVLSKKSQERILNAIYACPHGVIKWSDSIEGLVETSTNLASVKFIDGHKVRVVTSQRSSLNSAKTDIADRVAAVFYLADATIKHSDGYPGWAPKRDSEIVQITENAYRELFKKKPVVRAIHAGLECGLFLQKYPNLDMISFGPTIKGAHSPDERLDIPSTQKFWDLLLEVLKRIPEEN
ncbi:MAG: aminoacyl-histidine dipeptidase [Bacteroidales bacterium]|nr:aminoacyl-histidine dipeptidase [Bacteroidales bacterium]